MIDNDNAHSDEMDEDFAEKMRLLRTIEPTVASRVKNRKSIAAALAQCNLSAPPAAWWRQSISIPVPIATAACIVFLASFLGWLPRLLDADRKGDPVAGSTVVERKDSVRGMETTLDRREDEKAQLEYRASATYLCGVGRIRYDSAYNYPEDGR